MVELCPWCIKGVCRVGDESNCDFKSIPMKEDSIVKRIDAEFGAIQEAMREIKKQDDEKEIVKILAYLQDKMTGIKIMRDVLLEKFGKNYFPKGRIEFAKIILETHKHMRKFKTQVEVRKDGSGKKS